MRWNFLYQRPQHLMSRFARERRVIYWEEPEAALAGCEPALGVRVCAETGVTVVTPSIPEDLAPEAREAALRALLDDFIVGEEGPFIRWYCCPAMLPFSRHIPADCTVYDCIDEPTHSNSDAEVAQALERALFEAADLVFTAGHKLYEAKRHRHPHVHAFPSTVDRFHFGQARAMDAQPDDQRLLGRPRFGYHGIVDARIDLALLAALADAHPEWSIVIVGPVVGIEPAALPARTNLHYLGAKRYEELPAYLGGWDVALMPFAINRATRFISPMKTPECLAAGRPVVSTPVSDVVRHYAGLEAVFIAEGAEAFVAGCERALDLARGPNDWLKEVDAKLANLSWDISFARMAGLVDLSIGGAVNGMADAAVWAEAAE